MIVERYLDALTSHDWDALLAKHGAHRVETPFYSIFVYRLTRP